MTEAPAVPIPSLPRNLKLSVLKNTSAQVAGRAFIAIARLVVAGIIVRAYGPGTFGEYALLFGVLSIAEWIADFGTTEIFVREVCREPSRRLQLLRTLAATKLVQVPAAFIVFAAILIAMRYPLHVVEAGLAGAVSLIFFGGILVYRVIFKAALSLEREAAAELVSVLMMIPLISGAARVGGGLVLLMLCHTISRAVFFGVCHLLGRSQFALRGAAASREEMARELRIAAPIGAIGLLVAIYETVDVLLLSRLGSMSDVAYYSAAQRLVWPVLMALTSIGTTLYPVASSYWQRDRERFENACQRAVDSVVVLAGLPLCAMLAGAEFFLRLIGKQLVPGVPVLRILAILCFVKAITSTIGPLLYVVNAQSQALRFIAVATVVKTVAIAMLVPRMGYVYVAWAALAVEVTFAAIPSFLILRKMSGGYSPSLSVPLRTAAVMAATFVVTRLLVPASPLNAAILAAVLYVPLIFAVRAARVTDIRSLLKWRTA